MRKVFTPAAWKTVRYNRGKLGPTTAWTVTTSLTSLLLPLFTLCRINININTRCALRWARVARVAAPRAALVRLRKNGPTSALGRGEGVCAKRSFSTGRGAWSCARARVLLTGLSITPKSANSFAPSFKGSSCFITEWEKFKEMKWDKARGFYLIRFAVPPGYTVHKPNYDCSVVSGGKGGDWV